MPTSSWLHEPFTLAGWAAGAGFGMVLHRWRLRGAAIRVAESVGRGYHISLGLGAAAGAWASGSLNTLRDAVPTLSHSILGALAGATVAVELYKVANGIKVSTGAIFVGPLALGIAIGRWGCLFAGLPDLTYGTPTGLPWAVDLGDGIGRHPVQIYESAAMTAFIVAYIAALALRPSLTIPRAFYGLCLWYGLQRFAWEFLKPYPALVGSLNLFHVICLGLIVYGAANLMRNRRTANPALRGP